MGPPRVWVVGAVSVLLGVGSGLETYVTSSENAITDASRALDAKLAETIQTSRVTQSSVTTGLILGEGASWSRPDGQRGVSRMLYTHMRSVAAV